MRCDWCEEKAKLLPTEHFDKEGHLLWYCPGCLTTENSYEKEARYIMFAQARLRSVFSRRFRKRALHQFCLTGNFVDESLRIQKVQEILDVTRACDDTSFLLYITRQFDVSLSYTQKFFHIMYLKRVPDEKDNLE
jgi:hypothetical protein